LEKNAVSEPKMAQLQKTIAFTGFDAGKNETLLLSERRHLNFDLRERVPSFQKGRDTYL
jgi:hypothetical protein